MFTFLNKKAVAEQLQVDRLIVSDQLIKIDQLDYFKRKTFFKLLQNFIGLVCKHK